MNSLAADVATPMTAAQRAAFERDGFLIAPGVLSWAGVEFYAGALDRVYQAQQAADAVAPGTAMHLLSAVANCPEAAGLTLHASPEFGQLSPVRRQLLGGIGTDIDGQVEGDHLWGHYPATTPLYRFLAERGLLDPANPPLRG